MGRTRKGHNKGNLISGAPAADGQEEATLLAAGLAGPQANMSIFQRVRFLHKVLHYFQRSSRRESPEADKQVPRFLAPLLFISVISPASTASST